MFSRRSPRDSFFSLAHASTLGAFAACFVLAACVGCGGSGEPASSSSNDNQQGTSNSVAKTNGEGAGRATANGASGQRAFEVNPQAPVSGQSAENPAVPRQPAKPIERNAAGEIIVPDGSVEELLAFMQHVENHGRYQDTLEMSFDDRERIFTELLTARLAAAEKILAANPSEAQRNNAMHIKLEALRTFIVLENMPDAQRQFEQTLEEIAKANDPQLLELAKAAAFLHYIDPLRNLDPRGDKKIELEQSLEAMQKMLADSAAGGVSINAALDAIDVYESLGKPDAVERGFRLLITRFHEHDNEEYAALAETWKRDLVLIDFAIRVNAAQHLWEGSIPDLLDGVEQVLAMSNPSDEESFVLAIQAAWLLETLQEYRTAFEAYNKIDAAYRNHPEPTIRARVNHALDLAERRLGLRGKPFAVEGMLVDGRPFDWSRYEGKVVLVDFWATWSNPSLSDLPQLERIYAKYRSRGFEVVGVSLDEDPRQLEKFLAARPLPWATVISNQDAQRGFNDPNAVRCGLDSIIPFMMLIGRDGRVVALHASGPVLEQKLAELLGPVDETGAIDPQNRSLLREANAATSLAALFPTFFLTCEEPNAEAEAKTETEPKPAAEPTIEELLAKAAERNPYLAPANATTMELAEFLLDMQEKSKTIQTRPGFTDAIVEAADRVMAAEPADRFFIIAAQAKFKYLHRDACLGDADAEELLAKFVEERRDDTREPIVAEVTLLTLEKRALQSADLPQDEIVPLLAEISDYMDGTTLTDRHLRLASATVGTINRIQDEKQREEYFAEFGGMYIKSKDAELARYGKRIAKPAGQPGAGGAPAASQVGKVLELEGITIDDQIFRWEGYRGQVVLVDFWATWCGPCVAEMPHVVAMHDKYAPQGLAVVGVSLDDDMEKLATFIEEKNIPWETLAGEGNQKIASQYGVRGIPTIMLIDRDGKIVAVAHSVKQLEPKLIELLGVKEPAEAEAAPAEEPVPCE